MIDELRAAVDALNRGDPEPFVSLIDVHSQWRGVSHGRLWWKHSPACRGPEEAREVLQFLLRKENGALPLSAEFTQIGDKVIGSTASAPGDEHRRQERCIVFTIGDRKIIDMQGCKSRRAAERFASRR